MSATWETVGSDIGTGTFTQTGGSNSINGLGNGGGLYLGWNNNPSGICVGNYSLGGTGTLSVTGSAVVGYNGTGTITQTGGACTLPTLTFAYSSGSSGTYNLNGGRLSLTGLVAGPGTVAFNFGGGTLQAGGAFSTTVPMTLTGSGGNATVDTAGYTVTLSGSLSGTGGLTKTDSGTLVLAAANTYTGPTTISAGTLQIGNGGSGSIVTNVADNGTLAFDIPSGTFSKSISGSGGLLQTANVLTLTGSNTYTGPTTISAGTLQIGSGGTTGSINGTNGVADNGALAFDLSNSVTFSKTVTGSGGLMQTGPNVLTLTGSNTYTGNTNIASGSTLQIGSGGTAGSINGTSAIGGNGTLAYDLSTPTTLSFALTGGLGLMQMGPSLLVLTASNTYTGLTTIASGSTLQIGNGTTSLINSTNGVTDNGLLVFDISSGTFSKNISGSGGLTQMASGLLRLSARTATAVRPR